MQETEEVLVVEQTEVAIPMDDLELDRSQILHETSQQLSETSMPLPHLSNNSGMPFLVLIAVILIYPINFLTALFCVLWNRFCLLKHAF